MAMPDPGGASHADATDPHAGRFAYDGLDCLIHEKARLSIVASLATHADGLLFNDLKELCSLTDGNLSRHLQVLQKADLVEIWKGYRHNRPQTLCRLTQVGKRQFLAYVAALQNVVADAFAQSSGARRPDDPTLAPA